MKLVNVMLSVSSKDIEDVRKIHNKSKDDVQVDVQILKNWMTKQPHLPQNYDEGRLERMLMRNKFRIEQCKSKIDSYFTLRGLYPQFYENLNPTLEGLQNIRKFVMFIPMPVLTVEKERVWFFKYIPGADHLFSVHGQFQYILSLMDLEFSHDYAAATRLVVDCSTLNMNHITAFELNVTIKAFALYQIAYSARISSIDWFNCPKYINLIYKVLKIGMKPKMFNKIKIHDDLPTLCEHIDKKYLPSDYGGGQKSLQELHDQMGEMWKEEIDFLSQNAKLVSNEKLRIGEPYKNELFGVDGTFKKINLD